MFRSVLKSINETNDTTPISEIIHQRPGRMIYWGGLISAGICAVVLLFLLSIQYEPLVKIRVDLVTTVEGTDNTTQGKNIFKIPPQQIRWLKNGTVVFFHSASTRADSLKKGKVDSLLSIENASLASLVRIAWDDAIALGQTNAACTSELSVSAGKEPVLFKFLRQSF